MDEKLTYFNCGDWVESYTALVESDSGQMSIIRWAEESVHLLQEDRTLEKGGDNGRLAPAG